MSQSDKSDDVIGPSEAAALAGVDRRTIHRWTAGGHLTAALRTPGGQARYRRGDVLAVKRP
jgi:excisionase family DNA binding protein